MKEKFKMNEIFAKNAIVSCIHIPQTTMNDYFKDGRRSGPLVEYLLPAFFDNLVKNTNEGEAWDIDGQDIGLLESRVITKVGLKTMPSYMIGAGREFNKDGYDKKLALICGFILTDVRKWPDIFIVGVNTINICRFTDKKGSMTSNKIKNLSMFIQKEEDFKKDIEIKRMIIS